MKARAILTLSLMLVLSTSIVSLAQGTAMCLGSESGGPGPRLYTYSVAEPNGIFQLEVGTHDPNLLAYGNWLQPPGYLPMLFPNSIILDWPEKTPHGMLSPGPGGVCPFKVVWTLQSGAPPVMNGLFGYDNQKPSHDVGWIVFGGVVTTEQWPLPVGMGNGPVHGPVPEPSALLVLASGLAGLAGLLRTKRS